MSTKNSLTTLLQDLLKVQRNGFEILNKLSQVVSSNSDTVEIEILDENNNIKKVIVPSFGRLKSEINRLESNIKSLSGIGEGDSVLQLDDGTYRKIILNTLQKEASTLSNIQSPSGFNTKTNWFFESFLNPLLYISFDFAGQMDPDTKQVQMARYILNLDTTEKLNLFNTKWKGVSNISYADFLDDLLKNNISFYLDDDIIDLPPRTLRYYGDFSVLRVFSTTETSTRDGVTYDKRILRFKLDKLTYSDRDSQYINTQQLKTGDTLLVNSGNRNTRYRISDLDTTTNTIGVELIEGFDNVGIGANVLSYYVADQLPAEVRISIGFNERSVLFIKPIDPSSNIPSLYWSPGVGYYTNDLNITLPDGTQQTLDVYYKNQVVDFGAFLFSMAKDKIPPSVLGLTPYSPSLNSDDFKVVQINNHITDIKLADDIKNMHSDKIKLATEIDELSVAISKKREAIFTKKYKSNVERDADNNELDLLINKKATKSKLYNSIVSDINTKSKPIQNQLIKPKYRVRGFWPIPDARISDKTNPQEIVQFIVQYRYVSINGGSNAPKQISFKDSNGTIKNAVYSEWNEVRTISRKRIKDSITGAYTWTVENTEDGDSININQLDIPIQEGEGIEVRIKSLSEAGWPTNPTESDWSTVIRVDFPEELTSQNELDEIIKTSQQDEVRIKLQDELNKSGITQHLQNSTTINGVYYPHIAYEIHSGYLTPERNVISLYDKLQSIDVEIASLRDLIEKAKGKLAVKIVDENGTEIKVEQNQTIEIFAGNYKDIVKNLSIKKGVIVTKTYFIKIENEAASNLELYSRLPGNKLVSVPESWDSTSIYGATSSYNANDVDYNNIRKYDFVPLGLSNPTANLDYDIIEFLPYQSKQVKSQYIFNRYRNIGDTQNLYTEVNGAGQLLSPFTGLPVTSLNDVEYMYGTLSSSGGTAGIDFTWGGTGTTLWNTNTIDFSTTKYIGVHINHPDITEWNTLGSLVSEKVRMSKYAPVISTGTTNGNIPIGLQQCGYLHASIVGPTGRGVKLSFEENDQYLLGPYSCGCYMFMAPQNHDDLIVNGSDGLSIKSVLFGSNNAIVIPVIYQFRMTDYYGVGDSGLGRIAGDWSGSTFQLIYTKTMGFDIFHSADEKFSFDLKITSKYQSRTLEINDLPTRSIENTIDDLTRSIRSSEPKIVK